MSKPRVLFVFVIKQQIIKLIREKCIAQNREQFEFYEAYYNQSTGKIDRFRLDLLDKITDSTS
jgi:hypothetical protein